MPIKVWWSPCSRVSQGMQAAMPIGPRGEHLVQHLDGREPLAVCDIRTMGALAEFVGRLCLVLGIEAATQASFLSAVERRAKRTLDQGDSE